jgi:hypothetical protein
VGVSTLKGDDVRLASASNLSALAVGVCQ